MNRLTQRALVALSLAVFTLLYSLAARATVPVSSLPLGKDQLAPATGTTRITGVRWRGSDAMEVLVTAMDRAVCLSAAEGDPGTGASWTGAGQNVIVERLVEGDAPALERTLIEPTHDLSSAIVHGRGRVALARVEVGSELPVYAYRTAAMVHVIVPRGFNDPSDAFDPDPRVGFRTGCGFLHLTLATPEASWIEAVALAHTMPERLRWMVDWDEKSKHEEAHLRPDDFPSFTLNASVSKTSRDPEPLLSVSVRRLRQAD